MHLRWTDAAATDLERIADFLFSHAAERAPRLIRSNLLGARDAVDVPTPRAAGEDTRELVLSPLQSMDHRLVSQSDT